MKKTTALMLVLIPAIALGTFLALQPEPATACPPIICDPETFCGNICQRVYDQCIADGWPHSECAPKEDMCYINCINSN